MAALSPTPLPSIVFVRALSSSPSPSDSRTHVRLQALHIKADRRRRSISGCMDFTGDGAFSPTDTASIALLRHLRAGAGDDVPFVHRVDVCDAPPEVLVAGLEPVPGTGLDDDGYSSVWYFYHAKKYTNKQGKLSGHRQRKVTGGGGATWHSEISAKQVQGSGGAGTSCFLSYGRNTNPSARSMDRAGWCMKEYDFADAGNKQGDAGAASNYVLCKVYRTPRLKGKGKLASASSSCKNASSKQQPAKKKRKAGAGAGEHPEAPPAKLIQQPEPVQEEVAVQVQQQPAGPGGDFNFNVEDINFYVDAQQGAAGRGAESEHCHGGVNFNIEDFNVDEYMDILEMLRDDPVPVPEPGLQQQVAGPEHDDGRSTPVLAAQVTAGDTTTYGQCSSYDAPSWLYTSPGTGCRTGLLQLQGHDPLQASPFLSHPLTGPQGYNNYYY